MRLYRWLSSAVLVLTIAAPLFVRAQATASAPNPSQTLTLAEAEAIALANQPRLLASQERARAAVDQIRAARSEYFPTVAFNATGARVADPDTATAAGNITTSSLSDRFAYGGNLTQLVTDFGRTSALVGRARDDAQAQQDLETLTRAQVRLNVREAYYRVLGAEAVLRAAQAAQVNRQLVARQLGALAQSQLRSTLDVQFANVLVSEAELAVVRAQSTVAQERAHLATVMGFGQPVTAKLSDIPASSEILPQLANGLLQQAQTQRADLNAAESQQHAAQKFAAAEKRLSYPTLNVLATAGEIPYHDYTLHDNYAAAGFNLNIPVLNGGLFAARRAQAAHQASASAQDVQQLRLEVSEQVQDAWYRAQEARQDLDVTARLVTESRTALRLAQDRYSAGLGSIVELNEAQLNETSAEIEAADASYTWLSRRAELDFATGQLN